MGHRDELAPFEERHTDVSRFDGLVKAGALLEQIGHLAADLDAAEAAADHDEGQEPALAERVALTQKSGFCRSDRSSRRR